MVFIKLSKLKTINTNQIYYWGNKEKKDLITNIRINGFDSKKGVIKISKDYYIIDGHHRCKILGEMFGYDYEVNVKQINISRKTYVIILSLILILLSPLILIYRLVKYGFKSDC